MRIIPIGKHHFLQFGDYVTSFNGTVVSPEKQLDNLKNNYQSILNQNNSEEQALKKFIEITNAKYRPIWNEYQFDGTFKDNSYQITLPIKNGLNQWHTLQIDFWKKEDDIKYFIVHTKKHSHGTIRLFKNKNVKDFFEHFIGEVCYYNAVLKNGEMFPFYERKIRENFNFLPSLVLLQTISPPSLIDEIIKTVN